VILLVTRGRRGLVSLAGRARNFANRNVVMANTEQPVTCS
jgi:hypothetical protein